MSTPTVRRLRVGAVTVITAAALGLSVPAQADPTTGSLTGHLTAAGAPVSGANVTVQDDSTGFIAFTTTDGAGAFAVADVPPGQLKIQFVKFGVVAQWAHQQRDRAAADLFEVVAGAETVVDEEVIPTGTLVARLVDTDGAPIAASIDVTDNQFGTIATGFSPDGSFMLAVPPGQVRVRFAVGELNQYARQKTSFSDADEIEIRSGQVTELDETLLPTGSVTGSLVDSAGQAVANAFVQLQPVNNTDSVFSVTDGAGAFHIARAFAGGYRVLFSLPNGQEQWAHQKRTPDTADVITVTADQATTINETLLSTEAIAGRLLDRAGNGVAGAQVQVFDADGASGSAFATTDDTGAYRIDNMLIGDYIVRFSTPDFRHSQYAIGKTTAATANRFTVPAGGTVTVDDTLLPTGNLRVVAKDAATGAPLTEFCANAFGPSDAFGCTTTGEVLLEDLTVGGYSVLVFAEGLYLQTEAAAEVVEGTTQITVRMPLGGMITTTLRDSATGQPVAQACVRAMRELDAMIGESPSTCSDETGAVRIGPLAAGTYRLLTMPHQDLGYGIQWVGRTGGTGNQLQAAAVVVRSGQTTAAPAIKLDKIGTVTGRVTDKATGQPIAGVVVTPFSFHPGVGPSFAVNTDEDGRYTLSVLGPYNWPILFAGVDQYAWQWTGGTPNRYLATPVRVTAGGSVTANAALTNKIKISGRVRVSGGGSAPEGRIIAYNAVTGDIVGVDDFVDGRYELAVLGPQVVKLRHDIVEASGWYDRKADFAHATPVVVPANGTKTVNITVRMS